MKQGQLTLMWLLSNGRLLVTLCHLLPEIRTPLLAGPRVWYLSGVLSELCCNKLVLMPAAIAASVVAKTEDSLGETDALGESELAKA
ncbi:hypothetical protein [Aeromonas piscicola]|uniref:hypothetical protein n=1 Tax=Aeromonas piscicola TaxID=600645 RepID=UPI0028E8C868|nr:hypothetical protein [Aeromonas piscicola]